MNKDTGSRREKSIYQVIREKHPLIAYCERNGINFTLSGNSYRADSPLTKGHRGHNAFSIRMDNPEIWHDFSLPNKPNHGDVIEFCALLKHNGDKEAALFELLPDTSIEVYRGRINKRISDRQREQEYIQTAHEALKDYPQYVDYLHSRGVDDAQIERLKIGVKVISPQLQRLLIPRFNYDGVEVLYHKTRKLLENDKGGKYEGAYIGDNSFLHNVPLGLQTLSKKARFLVLCEGDFDALNFEREGFAVLGSGGNVFSHDVWRDILCVADNYSEFVLAFDNDKAGKEFTRTTAQNLFEANINFRVIDLPEGCKDINDFYRADGNLHTLIDDATPGLEYLALQFIPSENFDNLTKGKKRELREELKSFLIRAKRAGADDENLYSLCLALAMAMPEKWLDTVLKLAHKGQSEPEIIDAITKKYNLLYNERTGFYKYDSNAQIWINADETRIGEYMSEYLGATASTQKICSLIQHLKFRVVSDKPITEFNRLHLFAFKNGTLHYNEDYSERIFKPASPADYVTNRRPFNYDPEADCPKWLEALHVIFAGDERRIKCFQEFCGYALMTECKFHKALYLHGEGRNGKSTLLDVIRALFGTENSTSLEPAEFADRFSLIDLKDSLVNICTDAKQENITGAEANLKKAIAGEPLRACYKQKDFITFSPRAKIFFACNFELNTKDKTHSMTERFLLIDCPVHFVDNPQENTNEAQKILNIETTLKTELSGIFNWCVRGAKRLNEQKQFTITEEQSRINCIFVNDTDSIIDFVADFSPNFFDVDGNGRKITRNDIYARYLDFCEGTNYDKPVDVSRFHSVFKKTLSDNHIQYREKQTHEGTRYYVF